MELLVARSIHDTRFTGAEFVDDLVTCEPLTDREAGNSMLSSLFEPFP